MKRYIAPVGTILLLTIGMATGCRAQPPQPSVEYTLPELKYLVLADFDDVFWCDPDFYPVGRSGGEEQNAHEQFAAIAGNEADFSAILRHLDLPDQPEYTNEEKLLIYREHKKLTYQIEMASSGDGYQFTLRVKEGQGERIEGTVTPSGNIEITKREPSFNTCPICLARGTLIATTEGPVPVEQLNEGTPVWTTDGTGNRVKGIVIKTSATPVPSSFQAINVALSDGRAVTASPGHPTAEGRTLGDYRTGDTLDGAVVTAVEHSDYGGVTFDLLPSGETGLYWANGILMGSTIAK